MSAEFDDVIIDNMLEHDKEEYVVRELRLYQKDKVHGEMSMAFICMHNPFLSVYDLFQGLCS